LKTLHIGHHFYGAGNLGDDFMLAGFLAAAGSLNLRLTCCVPVPPAHLSRRFPQVEWRPYDPGSRRQCIDKCDAWLGLGGSPWQDAVSGWFAAHLADEMRFCRAAGKPMYFLGVGVQEAVATVNPELRAAAAQAEMIWTRDPGTAEALRSLAPGRVKPAADLAHIFLERSPPQPAQRGRLTAVLNFDYAQWPGCAAALGAAAALPARERVWLAQESRRLPGAEIDLFERLPAAERSQWRMQLADAPDSPLAEVAGFWPNGEWLLTSRYHAALEGAWAGSKAVVIAINDKLRAAADEYGYPMVQPDASAADWAKALAASVPPPQGLLKLRAEAARQACAEFFSAVGVR
jgi:polysaccharide pyruvyl transferase WcaK-like protein